MAQALVARPGRKGPVSLQEQAALAEARLRVDRAAGIIYGVKVLGLESANGRRYLPEAAAKARRLYEGASVRRNHPKRPDDSRDVEEVFGWLESVEVGPGGGLWANLHVLNPKTEFAESVFLAAEKNPKLFGLSHNAQGQGETVDGVFVVSEIVEVRSVDLVADPATTGGLFESRQQRRTMKLKDWLECPALKKLDQGKRAKLRKLWEAYGEEEMAEPEESVGTDPDEALKTGFRSACSAVLDSEDMDATAKVARLKELLSAHEKLSTKKEEKGKPGEGEEVEEEEDEDVEEDCDKDKMESKKVKTRLRELERKDRARDLCEAAGVVPSKALLKALMGLSSEADCKELIEEHKGKPAQKTKPRSGATGGGKPGAGGAEDDLGSFMEALRR